MRSSFGLEVFETAPNGCDLLLLPGERLSRLPDFVIQACPLPGPPLVWDNFDVEQDALMDAAALADRTVVLSGDVHFAAEHVNPLRNGGEFIEWTTPSVTSANLDDKMKWPRGTESRTYEAAMVRMLRDLRWCDLDSHGFLVIDCAPERLSCQWWFIDRVLEPSDNVELGHEAVLTN